MAKHFVDMSSWDLFNMAPSSKPGHMRTVGTLNVESSEDIRRPIGGSYTSLPQQDDTQRLHEVVTDSAGGTYIRMSTLGVKTFTSDFVSEIKVQHSGVPEIASWAQINGILFCGSPSFDTHYAFNGGSFYRAFKSDDPDDGFATRPVPRGICVEWGGRLVVASDDVLYYSNAANPFRFISVNVTDPPGGSIRGLFNVDGALIICTTHGVYALPQEAGLRRNVVGAFQKVSDYKTLEYGDVVLVNGSIFGVSKVGVDEIYPQGPETSIGRDSNSVDFRGRKSTDWSKHCYLVGVGEDSLAVVDRSGTGFFWFHPLRRFGSWIGDELTSSYALKSSYLNPDREIIFGVDHANSRSAFSLCGNRGSKLRSGAVGQIKLGPVSESRTLRKIQISTDTDQGGSAKFRMQRVAVKSKATVHKNNDSSSSWPVLFYGLEQRSLFFNISKRSDDHSVELEFPDPETEIPFELQAESHGIAKDREES